MPRLSVRASKSARAVLLAAAALVAGAGAQTGPAPADANVRGMWSQVAAWPLIAIHAVLLPGGRVLTYGTDAIGRQTGFFTYDVWDPAAGLGAEAHLTLPNGTGTDLFCGAQLVLPQSGAGVVLLGGDNWNGSSTTTTGNNNSNIFDPAANTLTRANNMNRARWYATATTLPNGETYIQGGTGGEDHPEIRSASGAFRLLSNVPSGSLDWYYPRNFVAPDGRVFGYDTNGVMYYVNPVGLGSGAYAGQLPAANIGFDASAAMFRPGRILQYGGGSNGAIVIDITRGTPAVTPTQSMSSRRHWSTATLLADGKVLATGGGSEVSNDLVGLNSANKTAEIWNPATGAWTVGAAGALARLYHSTALLLPDATVLVAGGGAPGPITNLNAEIYHPPYLFGPNGVLAPRPAIAAAPDVLEIGQSFALDVAGSAPVGRVTLVKTGSVTHSFNMDQRFLELAFTANGPSLSVQAPASRNDAPPGTYLLFVIDSAGVPSLGRIVRIEPPVNPAPAIGTGLTGRYYNDPGTGSKFTTLVHTRVDATVNFDWAASSPVPGVVQPDNFSVRWTGQVQALVSGNHVFGTISNDGARLWVNGVPMINNWTDHSSTMNVSAPIALIAGQKYSIVMEYYDRATGAEARLGWAYPGQPAGQVIPQSQLYP